MTKLSIKINGLEQLQKNLLGFTENYRRYLSAAGREAGEEVLDTEGVRRYPPATAANSPPAPYYVRGHGTQLKSYNLGGSERYGTQFFINDSGFKTTVGNRASYAKWLTDERFQARHMARLGWKKLFEVAKQKRDTIIRIYEGWVRKGIKEQNL